MGSNSKDELYKRLLETSPYGTLCFVYGICVDSNPRARAILACDKQILQGTSLDETMLSEPLALASLKQQINFALESGLADLDWPLAIGDGRENIVLHVQQFGEAGKELIVTLRPEHPMTAVALGPENDTRFESAMEAAPDCESRGIMSAESVAALYQNNPGSVRFSEPSRASVLGKFSCGCTDQRQGSGFDRDIYFDSLTGLPSRQLLIETIRQHQEETVDQRICAALMLVDLDHFKDINDSWGHEVGDQVIFKVARAIEPMIDDRAMVARMSGDEFMLFFPLAGDTPDQGASNANAMAVKVKEAIASPIFYDGNEFILTASVGIALLTDHETSAERALQYADTAMYEAKRKGRNGIAFFNRSITDKAQRQIGLNTRLRKAVDNQEFALYVQPQIDVGSGRVMGGEALLRWVNSDRITNMPAEFIPLLESSGLIVDVGHWVIRTACEYIRNFLDEGLWEDHMRLGINISPRQFNDSQLVDVIEHSIRSYEVAPRYLNFEVTESLMIEDVEDVISKMSAIKNLGAQFSIDDFGIGYSSMIYLKRLPFDWLKIDREFIHNIHRDTDSRGVVEAILAVSRQYGLHVTAEGVEDIESLEVLRQIGCDTYQGAHFSMPVPVDQFRNYLLNC